MISIVRKNLLVLGIAVNLGLIGYFKYTNFFLNNLNAILNTNFSLYEIILPLGISFYTFQQIAYLVDSYRGETKEYNLLHYTLFVSFFPQLIAGPIVHHKEIIPQFTNKYLNRLSSKNLAVGLSFFLLGLFKKVLLADSLVAGIANQTFDAAAAGSGLSFLDAWLGALAYTFQLYFDFSGYSDMAIGAARMFGIQLPINFNSPYKAVSISDFWRRWHITLSNFLRDYLYIPLGGSRKGELRRNINLIITMLLGGLWHGAGWTFVVWGGLHGVYLVLNHKWRCLRKSLGHDLQKTSWWSQFLGFMMTFFAVVVAWVFFRAENMSASFTMLEAMTGKNGISLYLNILSENLITLIGKLMFLSIIVWCLPNSHQLVSIYFQLNSNSNSYKYTDIVSRLKNYLLQSNIFRGIIFGLGLFIVVKIMIKAPESEFLYFKF
ncbi:MAG: MBOAT family protein [Nostocales cyanobacterium 94392]|nr:MBOAT family protein [Nostocales cyanobacterium 94392]